MRLVRSDAVLSLCFHVLKSLVALYVNWIVLRQFAVTDYVTWSVTSSILVIATASDLGIGQYAVTRLLHSDEAEWPAIIKGCFIAMLPLAVVSLLFVAVAINGPSLAYSLTMAALLALRVLSIPFGAVLNAVNQFKIRKAIELMSYVIAAIMITLASFRHSDITLALIALNVTFLIGAGMTALAAGRFVSFRQIAASRTRILDLSRIYGLATPFMVNNLTNLLTYGGFIWVSSLIVSKTDVAKLALLHSFVLVSIYQLYDVFLKSRQGDLMDTRNLTKLRTINSVVMLITFLSFSFGGVAVLQLISAEIKLREIEVIAFAAFMAFELGILFIQSIVQVHKDIFFKLTHYSLFRLLINIVSVFVLWIFFQPVTIISYLLTICALSILMYFYLKLTLEIRVNRSNKL